MIHLFVLMLNGKQRIKPVTLRRKAKTTGIAFYTQREQELTNLRLVVWCFLMRGWSWFYPRQ